MRQFKLCIFPSLMLVFASACGGVEFTSAADGGAAGQLGTGGNAGSSGQAGQGGTAAGDSGISPGTGGNAGFSGGSAGQSNTGGAAGISGSDAGAAGSAGQGGSAGSSPTCSSSDLGAPKSCTITGLTGYMGAEFRPRSGPDEYSQTSPSPIVIAGHNYPAQVVQIGKDQINITFEFGVGATNKVLPTFYSFDPASLQYPECQGAGQIYSHSCLLAVTQDFRCQYLGQTSNCPADTAGFSVVNHSQSYSKSDSGNLGVLAEINCP